MSGDVDADRTRSTFPVPPTFRFSPRPHHAHLIRWRAWGAAAFQEAQEQKKPIFLLISSLWCQWCHIMDETTLSEPAIISILNSDYIPIRVDSDLRPDINQRYNQNGLPSVLLLTPDGEILWGGVYVPARQMLYYLGHVRRSYSEHAQEIEAQVRELQDRRFTRKLSQALPRVGLRSLLAEERIELANLPGEAGRVLRDLYDADYGGFCIHPHMKFPHPDALELLLLLARHEQSGQDEQIDALDMVTYSLEQMCEGGLWDKEDGGFFRYSAASDWSMPHTEKMLDENAAMLRLLLLTAEASGSRKWRDLSYRLARYMNTTLWQERMGVFSGSQSADEEYYESGLSSRTSRPAPPVDTTIYTAANARAISSYLLGARIQNDARMEKMALRALDWLCEHMVHREGSMYHYFLDGYAGLPGQLTDQVWMTRALLDAYDLYGRKAYLETAIALMHFACEELLDGQNGLFYDYAETAEAQGRLYLRDQPLVENAIAAECLLRMAAYSHRSHLRDTGLLVLYGCLDKYRRAGIQGATYACVVAQVIENGWL